MSAYIFWEREMRLKIGMISSETWEFDSKNMSNTNKSSQVDPLDHVRNDLRSKINIAYMVSSLAAFCITSLVSLIPGDKELEMYRLKLSFRAYVVLSLFSFCAGTAAIVLVELIPITLKSAKAALLSIWVSVCLLIYALGFGLCVFLPESWNLPVMAAVSLAILVGRTLISNPKV
ncbi:hypothetical protein QJS10_CPB22g00282 [Acorus calamus]|uniref:PGG domain-containing protein n=1 Tax=Acorus calamus TaxID=4465 RepID=A0AAV9BYN6_ACOCL|nr:hypothetical protein QJS10_CPB22g00282 [Acorus calamus]